jgi:short-subunit dehydrogenase
VGKENTMAGESGSERVVLITGASSGIGRATAHAFAERGNAVVAVARRESLLQSLLEEIRERSPRSFFMAGDLAERSFAEGIVHQTVERLGRLDVLVNNAAITKHKHIYHVDADEVAHVMNVNFMAAVWSTLAALAPMLRQGGGTIVNVSSFAALVTPPRETVYAASKGAMNSFTEGLWNDLAGSNIHAGIVNPGPIDTEIWQKLDEPAAYDGPKYDPRVVVDAIFEVVDERRHEVTAPKRNPSLVTARWLRLLAPRILRAGMARMDPVPSEVIERARRRAGG